MKALQDLKKRYIVLGRLSSGIALSAVDCKATGQRLPRRWSAPHLIAQGRNTRLEQVTFRSRFSIRTTSYLKYYGC